MAKREQRKGIGTYRTRSGATVVVWRHHDGSLRATLGGWEDPDPRIQGERTTAWYSELQRVAEALAPGNQNARNARAPRRAVTKAQLIEHRAQYVARNGKVQGWQKTAELAFGISAKTIRARLKEN